MGEIGGNDYNYALFEGKTVAEVKNMVPRVVQTIMDATKVCESKLFTCYIKFKLNF